ncbi:MAG: DUF1059 domain-containing protein [Dehalococcoidia bacterium]|nr:DUF1059 domain-containing protein [Dehalococcoidia bacterium]
MEAHHGQDLRHPLPNAGMHDDFQTRGASKEDVLRRCAEHATANHGMKAFGPELYAKMRARMKEIEE